MANEFDLIEKYFLPLTGGFPGALGLKDDAAIIESDPEYSFIVTKDAIVENVHFLKFDPALTIGQKLMGVNLSDLAAMGALPYAYFLSVILPKSTSENWVKEFCAGIKIAIGKYGGVVSGGDSVRHDGPITLSLTAIGKVKKGRALKRSGAKCGDLIFVSGSIGSAYLGLQILQGKLSLKNKSLERTLISSYQIPVPRIELGNKLIGVASACIDISDGLLAELNHICKLSGQGAEIYMENIPMVDGWALPYPSPLPEGEGILSMITAGDDYELLFTVPESKREKIEELQSIVPITEIGRLTNSGELIVLDKHGQQVKISKFGYEH